MKLRPVTEVAHISILKVVEQLFIQNSSYIIKIDFAEDCDYDNDISLNEIFEEEDINYFREKVFNIMYTIAILDKESE